MLPAVVKLCCGITYPHLRSMAGLQRAAVAVIGQEISHLHRREHIQHQARSHTPRSFRQPSFSSAQPARAEQWFYQKLGRDAMETALGMLQERDGWKREVTESNGDLICSKVLRGNKKVFRLEAVLDATVDELYDVLFLRLEEMHRWNPSIQQIRVLQRVGPETVVTHEVSAETAGNLIGQRDFLSVRHSCKHQSRVYLGGTAIQLEALPPQSGFVRAEDGPTCIVIEPADDSPSRSKFTWLLNMDVKGWLPKSLVNQAIPRAQLDFTRHLRRHLTAGGALTAGGDLAGGALRG
ncbi:steroidogenic acute regulatory protein, mitochondrial [Eucyclogobius newberryi]|uniref:steroidogenic acute regulatory protein, mitochondrial n=1 Tax=Eucyclogobius newberryi TaxID=166745 RepID=UPI003B5AFDDA